MSYAVLFALLSLLLNGVNDIVFKIYSTGGRSRGIFLFGVGLIWTLSQWGLAKIQGTPLEFNQAAAIDLAGRDVFEAVQISEGTCGTADEQGHCLC